MLGPIVVPLDGSGLAERALAPARVLARSSEAVLYFVRVATPRLMAVPADPSMGALYPEQVLAEAREDSQDYLRSLTGVCTADELDVRAEVRDGDVAGALVDAARESNARLIVMSSHGYSGVRRWLLGSVAEKVLLAAPCPVWVVRAPALPRHLLITLDGSRLAEEVVVPALAVARACQARVTLLRVVPELNPGDIAELDKLERGMGQRYVEEMNDDAAGYLAHVADLFGDAVVPIDTAVRVGSAAEAILDFAEHNGVDLVAMTTHGRTGLRRWIYGSVTQKVLHQLPVSMLVARSGEASLN
jgi:nucleotide-binding universal stress UspA family protein